jgi:His/Glu/Gln/Arg/opine family amino acid ABC transporter permease subunit
MVDFSLWDIFRNLLLAARWTVLLSLVAFAGGGLVALALLLARLAKWRGAETGVAAYVQLFQGTPLLMQLFLAYFGLAGERAAETAKAPGTYQMALLDALFTIDPEMLQKGARIDRDR